MEARNDAVSFELNARTVSLDYIRADSHKQVFNSRPFNRSRNGSLNTAARVFSCLLFMLANLSTLADYASTIQWLAKFSQLAGENSYAHVRRIRTGESGWVHN